MMPIWLAALVLLGGGCGLSTEGVPAVGTASTASAGADSSGQAGGTGGADCPTGFTCVPAAEADVVVRLAAGELACPAGFEAPVVVGDGAQPGCEACACGAAQGTCTAGDIEAWGSFSGGNCSGNNATLAPPPVATCVDAITGATDANADAISGASAILVEPPTPSAGDCASGAAQPAAFGKQTLCTATAAMHTACDGGLCLPAGDRDFGVLCVVGSGAECQRGLGVQMTVHALQGDDRDCSCSCSPTSGTCSGAGLALYSDGTCGSSIVTLAADGKCKNTSSIASISSFELAAGTWSPSSPCAAMLSSNGSLQWGPAVDLCCNR